jgi:hypothetical protein
VEVSRERFGLFGAFVSGLVGLERRLGREVRGGGHTDMDDQANQPQGNQEELVKQ